MLPNSNMLELERLWYNIFSLSICAPCRHTVLKITVWTSYKTTSHYSDMVLVFNLSRFFRQVQPHQYQKLYQNFSQDSLKHASAEHVRCTWLLPTSFKFQNLGKGYAKHYHDGILRDHQKVINTCSHIHSYNDNSQLAASVCHVTRNSGEIMQQSR